MTVGAGLDGLSENGRFCVLAIDHRDSLRAYVSPDDPDAVSAEELVQLKIDVIGAASHLATGAMLEPEYSIPQVLDAGALAPGVGFCAALESQGYLGRMGEEPTTILDGWSVAAAKASGASACKLLLPYHPDRPIAASQEEVGRDIIAQCRAGDLPLVLEPLYYDLDGPEDRRRVVLETASRFAAMDPHLLKLPFPVDPTAVVDRAEWADACADLASRISMPWTLLSGGGSFESFADQVACAMEAGAAGCMVGRALWGEAVTAPPAERADVLANLVIPRLAQLRSLVMDGVAAPAHDI